MRKLLMSLLVASFASAFVITCANAGVWTAAQAQTDTQVKWEAYRAGWTWDQNQTFMDELHQSIKRFFGNTVGVYFPQTPDDPHPLPSTKWSLISAQFLGYEGRGEYSRGTILDGRWQLYAFANGTNPVIAWVTPIGSTKVVAAAITHQSCGLLDPKEINDPAAFAKHFTGKCDKPQVTIFFKDSFSYDQAIRDVLIKLMSQDLVRDCNRDFANGLGITLKRYVARHGHQPPQCGMPWQVVMLNALPQE